MNKIDKQYTDLLQDILDNGFEKDTRNGKVLSVFGRTIRHNMKNGFPLLTTKKMHFKGIVTELLWFLKGDTNIKYLVDNDCNIWTGDAYKNFEKRYYKEIFNYETGSHNRLMSKDEFILNIKTYDEFAQKWGDLGPIYGKQWRRWKKVDEVWDERLIPPFKIENIELIDQIANVINDLKTDPDSRRLLVTAWNPADLSDSVLPPCHYSFQFYTRELSVQERNEWFQINRNGNNPTMKSDWKDFELDQQNIPKRYISLIWNQRSVDTPLGLPFNIASYALLLQIVAKQVNMIPEEVIGNLGDCHIYTNQIEGVKEQLTREPYPLPKLVHMKTDDFYKSLSDNPSLYGHLDCKDFQIEEYQSHPAIKMPLSN